jgi:predicted MPP superfamily phosphohydrolase
MAPALELALTLAAFLGHFSISVWLFNRLHAVALPRRAIKLLEKLLLLAAAAVVFGFLFAWGSTGHGIFELGKGWLGYFVFCWLIVLVAIPNWLIPKLRERAPTELVSNDTTQVDVVQRLGFRPVHGVETRLFARIPGNQLLQLAIQRKTLRLRGLPSELDGLTIAHLSDLHMTGKVGREYYDLVVDETNALDADLIAITGDILEKERCLPWIAPTLGRLRARVGKYFILGNHETRLADVQPLRQALALAGITDLGSRTEIVSINGVEILVAGNELPWFGETPMMPRSRLGNVHFRLLLSHSPDQLPLAKRQGFELMLAGHNHGGQIRLPLIGALIAPSLYGCRYAGGLYYEEPTLLHVSRGLGGVHPIRLNCPPELALLVLKTA